MILCKTEKFPGSITAFGAAAFRQHTARHIRLKEGSGGWYKDQPHLKTPEKSCPEKAISTAKSIGIMTNAKTAWFAKSAGFWYNGTTWIPGGGGMALNYTVEKRNSLDKETLIQLFLSQQEQLMNIDRTLQLVLEQMADLKRHRFGRSSERHEPDEQISFMEVDGKIVFFNESEAVAAEESGEDTEPVLRRKPKKKHGKREDDLEGLPVVVIEHSLTQEELTALFGEEGFKQLPDEVYRRYGFTPAKVEVEEHHVKVYAGKKTDEIVRAPHPESLLRGSLVSPSLEAAVMNAKYVNAVPLYRQEQEFLRYGLHISR